HVDRRKTTEARSPGEGTRVDVAFDGDPLQLPEARGAQQHRVKDTRSRAVAGAGQDALTELEAAQRESGESRSRREDPRSRPRDHADVITRSGNARSQSHRGSQKNRKKNRLAFHG